MAEKKLSIQIAEINRIEVDDVNLTEAGEDEVFQKLTSNSTSANQKYSGLQEYESQAEARMGCRKGHRPA